MSSTFCLAANRYSSVHSRNNRSWKFPHSRARASRTFSTSRRSTLEVGDRVQDLNHVCQLRREVASRRSHDFLGFLHELGAQSVAVLAIVQVAQRVRHAHAVHDLRDAVADELLVVFLHRAS